MRGPRSQETAPTRGKPSWSLSKGICQMTTLVARTRLVAAICLPALLFACGGAPSSSAGSSAAAESKKCKSDDRPAACPGGGEAQCTEGKWECAPLPGLGATASLSCDP